MWAMNTFTIYQDVMRWVKDGWTDEEIATQWRQSITRSEYGSDYLMSREDGDEGRAFGDSDGVTFDDIDWSAAIDYVTDRTEG